MVRLQKKTSLKMMSTKGNSIVVRLQIIINYENIIEDDVNKGDSILQYWSLLTVLFIHLLVTSRTSQRGGPRHPGIEFVELAIQE